MTIPSRFIRPFAWLASVATTPVVHPCKRRRPDKREGPQDRADLYDWEDECGRLTANEVQTSLARSPGAVESIR